ncbi:MAG: bifunctional ADP-dependent NAD(P)H-hydrate dehydratase/NAD(P)H-hydrate epimerase [Candidatus Marinimicrobia bacterium CG08_land_8_20_14_0_20_45_22]|nr:MAG: bifunctional ADP-dependent NAD(P)H-hydrate dehydratase/NAD(P)H-hydrate epimerase [Candidatus Marinimicrobia bacterium CG08_land_8_20_14_0_20_45_22]
MKEFVLNNQESHQINRFAIEKLGISGRELMWKAGGFVSLKAKKILKDVPNSRIDFFCGVGNNGGDGFAAAGNLSDWGANVFCWLLGDDEKIKGDAAFFYDQCINKGVPIRKIATNEDILELDELAETELIVDAIFGTGFKGDIPEIISKVIQKISESNQPVLSVDIPSGVNGDTGQVGNCAVNADWTITMGFLKRGLLFYPGKKYAGEVFVVDLNYPKKSFEIFPNETFLISRNQVKNILPLIPEDTYKHRQGKALIIAGSPGMTGAATLAGMATLRGGAGLVVVAVPESLNPIMEVKLTEAMTIPVPESSDHTFNVSSLDSLKARIEWSDVVAFGPGVSTHSEVIEFGKKLLVASKKPLIVDADGLRIFKDDLDQIRKIDDLILTPHHGEFSMITGIPVQKIAERTIDIARQFAMKYSCTLVLKGAPTVIADRNGAVAINPTGNAALATGGTGDVLTGLITAFRAQGISSFDASIAAVSIHGTAGDLGKIRYGTRSFIAGDLFEFIPKVLKKLERLSG